MKVSDVMTQGGVTANLKDGLRQTWLRMRERDIRHMPVLNGTERVVGIISDRDVRRPLFVDVGPETVDSFRLDNSMTVAEAMTDHPVTVRADDDLTVALSLFVDRRFGALPVVGDDDRLEGMLSVYDLLGVLQGRLADHA